MYVIFYLYLAIFVNGFYNGFCNAHNTVNKLFSTFIVLLSSDVNINSDGIMVDYKTLQSDAPDKILLISNHVKLIDYISLHTALIRLYPKHLPVFVSVDKVKKLPYYGNIFSKYYILINRKDPKTSILDMIQRCKELKKKKVVIVLFPEGDIYRYKNKVKSDNYCEYKNIEKFNNILHPKVKAYDIILKYFKPDQIKLSQLRYFNKYHKSGNKSFTEYKDFLNIFKKYPICDIILTSCEKEKPLIDIWRQLDSIL
jgi:hypothetical protein